MIIQRLFNATQLHVLMGLLRLGSLSPENRIM